ncbi:MAG TPA: twitching motility protein, partial [Thermoanaerobaculia bacterium]|nr:twitching motility protein [Thermoanaerobaculia bacterium]
MKNFNLDTWLEAVLKVSERVSDLNFSVGRPPQVEIDGTLQAVPVFGLQRLTPFQTETIALHVLRGDADKIRTLVETGSTDASYAIPGKTRFRVNVFQQRGTYSIVLRVIPNGVPT